MLPSKQAERAPGAVVTVGSPLTAVYRLLCPRCAQEIEGRQYAEGAPGHPIIIVRNRAAVALLALVAIALGIAALWFAFRTADVSDREKALQQRVAQLEADNSSRQNENKAVAEQLGQFRARLKAAVTHPVEVELFELRVTDKEGRPVTVDQGSIATLQAEHHISWHFRLANRLYQVDTAQTTVRVSVRGPSGAVGEPWERSISVPASQPAFEQESGLDSGQAPEWPAGEYEVELSLNGEPRATLRFRVQ